LASRPHTLLIVIVLGCALMGCVQARNEPPRPAGVPADATWVGGADGGAFVSLSSAESPESYSATVYYESGDVWYRGRLVPQNVPASKHVRVEDVSAWDGTQLILKEGAGALVVPSR